MGVIYRNGCDFIEYFVDEYHLPLNCHVFAPWLPKLCQNTGSDERFYVKLSEPKNPLNSPPALKSVEAPGINSSYKKKQSTDWSAFLHPVSNKLKTDIFSFSPF